MRSTVFFLISAHAPISAPSYFKVKIIHVWSILATKSTINKRPSKMIYLSTLGAYWNEYGMSVVLSEASR